LCISQSIIRATPKYRYGRKEEKIPFTYIYNTYMVLVVSVLTLYGEKLPQIAPNAAKMPGIAPQPDEALVVRVLPVVI
jgi:hypothetical protein